MPDDKDLYREYARRVLEGAAGQTLVNATSGEPVKPRDLSAAMRTLGIETTQPESVRARKQLDEALASGDRERIDNARKYLDFVTPDSRAQKALKAEFSTDFGPGYDSDAEGRYWEDTRAKNRDLLNRQFALESARAQSSTPAPEPTSLMGMAAQNNDLIQRRDALNAARQQGDLIDRRDALNAARNPSADPANLAPQFPDWMTDRDRLRTANAFNTLREAYNAPARPGIDLDGKAVQQALVSQVLMDPIAQWAQSAHQAALPAHLMTMQPQPQPEESPVEAKRNRKAPGY